MYPGNALGVFVRREEDKPLALTTQQCRLLVTASDHDNKMYEPFNGSYPVPRVFEQSHKAWMHGYSPLIAQMFTNFRIEQPSLYQIKVERKVVDAESKKIAEARVQLEADKLRLQDERAALEREKVQFAMRVQRLAANEKKQDAAVSALTARIESAESLLRTTLHMSDITVALYTVGEALEQLAGAEPGAA